MIKNLLITFSVFLFLGLCYWFAARPMHIRWGSTDAEVNMSLPGDDLVPGTVTQSTRAITIHAPTSDIYPWLLQMGQGRGGLYSYDWLENLFGCDIHSVDRIVPELQNPVVGTVFRLGPYATLPYYRYTIMIPNQAVVLRAADPQSGQPTSGLWMFALEPIDGQTTRLIIRHRDVETPGVANFIFGKLLTDPISFVMEEKMMRGIRDRSEVE